MTHINVQSQVAGIIIVINKRKSGMVPHMGKDTGWGRERQHSKSETLSMVSLTQSLSIAIAKSEFYLGNSNCLTLQIEFFN